MVLWLELTALIMEVQILLTDLFESVVLIGTGNRNAYNPVYFDDIILAGHAVLLTDLH